MFREQEMIFHAIATVFAVLKMMDLVEEIHIFIYIWSCATIVDSMIAIVASMYLTNGNINFKFYMSSLITAFAALRFVGL